MTADNEVLNEEQESRLHGQGDGVPQAGAKHGTGPRGSRTYVCAVKLLFGWHTQGEEKGEVKCCLGFIQSAW